MYLKQFNRDLASILKYLPFIVVFLGYMGVSIVSSFIMDTNSSEMIQDLINNYGKNLTFFSILMPFAFLLLMLFLWWKLIHKLSITSLTTSRKKIDYKRVTFSFILWIFLNIIILVVTYLINPSDFEFHLNWQPFVVMLLIALIFIPLQTSFEEYFFRGYFMQFTAYLFNNRALALIVTSVIFGLMHLSNPEVGDMGYGIMIYYIGCGLFLGIITLMDEGLELALGFHAAINIFASVFITSESAVFQTDALFLFKGESNIWEILVQVFVIFPILLIVYAKKYHWANWKEKLFKRV